MRYLTTPSGGRLRARPATAALTAALIVIVAAIVLLPASPRAATRVPPANASVSIAPGAGGTPIPPGFLELSTEYWALPQWAHRLPLLYRALNLLRAGGPLTIRVGGISADRSFWSPHRRLPHWAFAIGPPWLRELRRIVQHTGARVILDLNLITGSPGLDARLVRAAIRGLPEGTVTGLEIGNGPDTYDRAIWRRELISRGRPRQLPARLGAAGYAAAFRAEARTLAAVAPGVPLLGPALAQPADVGFIRAVLAAPHPGLGAITVHRYPFSACVPTGSAKGATIGHLLSTTGTVGLASSIAPALRIARAAGLPLRLTELNSVTCGGVPGVSDAFATALWAPGALFSLSAAGVASAAVHVRADAVNAAFVIDRSGFTARPLFYGLLAFERSLGPGARLVRTRLHADRGQRLSAWETRSSDGVVHLLLINRGPRGARVRVRAPDRRAASAITLIAPSARSTGGVSLGGRWLGRDARWHGAARGARIRRFAGSYRVEVRGDSAELITS